MAFQSKIQCWAQILLLMVDTSCKERTLVPFFKVTKHIDRLAPSHQAVLFDGPLIHAYLPCGNTCYRKNGQSWVFPSCQAEVARCLRKVLQTGSFSGHSTPPHYPGRCLLQENGLLGPAVKQEDGKWGVDGQQFNIFLQMAVFMPTRDGAWWKNTKM